MVFAEYLSLNYPWLGLALVACLLASLEIGRRLGARSPPAPDSAEARGITAAEGAVFALLGLLLAFTFSSATSRFEQRRELVVKEANAIGTAYLRLDLLDEEHQRALRPLFRRYVEVRLNTYKALAVDNSRFRAGLEETSALQARIWRLASEAAARSPNPSVMSLVLPPINDMIDITSTRVAAIRAHLPTTIYGLLVLLAIASGLLVGRGMTGARRPWLHMLLFTLAIASTIYVILDVEYPRRGLIRVDSMDIHMIELLDSMRK